MYHYPLYFTLNYDLVLQKYSPFSFLHPTWLHNLTKSEKHLTWLLVKHRHLNRSITFKISLLDMFPLSEKKGILKVQFSTYKSLKPLIYRFLTHLLVYPSYQYNALNMARDDRIDVFSGFLNLAFAETCQ